MSKKKLIIFIGSLTSGGAERVAVTISKYFSNHKNYSVVVVTLNEDDYDFYSLGKNVKRVSMNMSGATSGINKYLINIKRVLAFREIVKQEKPDIVLGMITRQAVISILACVRLPAKVLVSERNYPEERQNHSMWERLRKIFYRFADHHVVQTNKIAKWIKENTGSKNISVIPNSITWPLPEYRPTLDPGNYIKQEEKIILAVGSLKPQKGFDILVESVSEFLNSYPEWKLIILGGKVDELDDNDGFKYRRHLQKIIEKHALQDQVILPGKAGNIGEWYQRADIFVLSSRYEGFPNVLLEALSSGIACVAFDCDTGPRDMIQHYENGILVEHLNTKDLNMAIQKLINDDELRKNLSKNAARIKEVYSEESIMNKWLHLFEELKSQNSK